jgi:transcriptional regulator with XRE-family HTH domain
MKTSSHHTGPAYDNRRRLGIAFAEVLRAARRDAHMTQEELHLASGLDRTYMSLLERGERTPSLAVVFILARTLGVAAVNLVGDTLAKMGE